jgi:hypothetical protein
MRAVGQLETLSLLFWITQFPGWTSTARFTARANMGLRLGAAPVLVWDSSRVRTWIQLNERF